MNGSKVNLQRTPKPNDRWKRLLSFLDRWNRPIRIEDGLAVADVERAEDKLGFPLPLALREWYLLSGYRSSEKITGGESLRKPEKLLIYDGALVFYDEPQGTVAWGIRERDLASPDPPVVVAGDSANVMPSLGWFEQNRSVTEFIFQIETKHALLNAKHRAIGHCNDTTFDLVNQRFRSLGFPDWYWPEYPTRLLGGIDLLIELHGESSIHAAARSERKLQSLIALLHNVQWHIINGHYVGPDTAYTRMRGMTLPMVRVFFDLHGDLSGAEGVWAKQIDEDTFRLIHVPLYTLGYAKGDIVRCSRHKHDKWDAERNKVIGLAQDSGNGTIRLLFADNVQEAKIQSVLNELASFRCSYERPSSTDVSVNVPPNLGIPFSQLEHYLSSQPQKVLTTWQIAKSPSAGG